MRRTDPFETFLFTLSNRSVSEDAFQNVLLDVYLMGFLKWFGYFKFLALFLHLCTHLDLFTQTLVYEISHFNFSLFFFFQAMDFMDTLFIDSLGFFFLSNLNNDCFSVCGGATVREAAVATSEASLLSSFCGTHASSMSLMCFFFCFFFFLF